MELKKAFFLLLIASLAGCYPGSVGYKYNQGWLPETPVNLEEFNTKYDDYNSTAPTLGYLIPFCFSTNRNSKGLDFDIIYKPMNVNFSKSTGELKVTAEYANWGIYQPEYDILVDALKKINTSKDEFGPYLLYNRNNKFSDTAFVLLYATDSADNHDIKFIGNKDYPAFSEPAPVEFLNSDFNDLYPVFNSDFTRIYFCSDREEGVFNIYLTEVEISDNDIAAALSSTEDHEVQADSILSSEFDDKCPFIFGNKMVFTSNRSGGFGGYDLYYSKFENGEWGSPVNFGDTINTEYDEYRPILVDEGVDQDRTMMIFSSDRSGGKGGFDLYFVGIPNEL